MIFVDDPVAKYVCANVANKPRLDISGEKDFLRQKRITQREILVHICRESTDQRYHDLLHETENWHCVKKETGYTCMFAGCNFKNKLHSRYVNHLKNTHFVKQNLLCNFKRKCKRRFNSVSALEEHIHSQHLNDQHVAQSEGHINEASVRVNVETGVPCKCCLSSCGERQFASIKELKLHYNSLTHKQERRPCFFEGCDVVFNPSYQSRRHFRTKHAHSSTLKPEFTLLNSRIVTCENESLMNNPGRENQADALEYSQSGSRFAEDTFENERFSKEDTSFDFLKAFGDFFSRLCYVHMIPQTTIQIITDEFLDLAKKSHTSRMKAIKSKLEEEFMCSKGISEVLSILKKMSVLLRRRL